MARDKRGIWYVWFDRTHCRSLRTRDKDEAKTLYTEVRREYLRGKLHLLERGPRISLQKFRTEYLKTRKGIAASTYRSDSLALRKLEDHTGNLPDLRQITPHLLAGWVSSMRPALKAPSINCYLRTLRSALSVAREWKYIEAVPLFKFETEDKKIPRLVDLSRIDTIADPYVKRLAIAYAWTGCRRAELHRATWGDIFGNLLRVKGKRRKERMVPLLPIVREALGPAGKPADRIFPRWAHPDSVSHALSKALGQRPHDMRHTTASMLVLAGADLHSVMEILGHNDIRTTQGYLHSTEKHLMEAMKRLESARRKRGMVLQLPEKTGGG